ncbi:MAG: thioredoxin family protein [Lachnospiraceae bacterium]|nr:thioredoxin family protein [Lachnospiraceae bacterium]
MGLFGFGKKKEEAKGECGCGCNCESTETKQVSSCCCDGGCNEETTSKAEDLNAEREVKVLGSGCAKCNALEAATKEALIELGMDTTIEHVTDFAKIAAYGVMTTPALVVDGKVVSFGKVLKKDDVVKILQKAR